MADGFLPEFELGDYKRQLNLMISELLNGEKLMVLLRLGRQSYYVTVGSQQQKCSLQSGLTKSEEGKRSNTSKLLLG